jgi:hypothetical protein
MEEIKKAELCSKRKMNHVKKVIKRRHRGEGLNPRVWPR